ncbi:hypothetical protein PS2_015362 [Malus domestica]
MISSKTDKTGVENPESVHSSDLEQELMFKPDSLRGTLEKMSSANALVSADEDNPYSTSLPTTSAGDFACLAARNVKFFH